jgi:hypothetical protein
MKNITLALICVLLATVTRGQDRVTTDPDSAVIITTDIANFWRAFDLLRQQKTSEDSLMVVKTIFLDKASEGLRQYMKAAGCYEKQYLETIRKRRTDYLSVRPMTEAVAGKKPLIVQYLRKFKQLYPGLKIPVICFTIGKFEVGGTQFDNTLYIGCEKDLELNIDIAAQTIHELAHFQQKDQNPSNNLGAAMVEGGAEFICYQVSGKRTLADTWTYGVKNEKALWKEFQPILDSAVDVSWFLAIPDKTRNRPGSLGYFIGYRICETYLSAHSNKKLALTEIIEMEDPEKIFLASQYN